MDFFFYIVVIRRGSFSKCERKRPDYATLRYSFIPFSQSRPGPGCSKAGRITLSGG